MALTSNQPAPVNGPEDVQYDERFCFTFDGLVFQNKSNGAAVNPV